MHGPLWQENALLDLDGRDDKLEGGKGELLCELNLFQRRGLSAEPAERDVRVKSSPLVLLSQPTRRALDPLPKPCQWRQFPSQADYDRPWPSSRGQQAETAERQAERAESLHRRPAPDHDPLQLGRINLSEKAHRQVERLRRNPRDLAPLPQARLTQLLLDLVQRRPSRRWQIDPDKDSGHLSPLCWSGFVLPQLLWYLPIYVCTTGCRAEMPPATELKATP